MSRKDEPPAPETGWQRAWRYFMVYLRWTFGGSKWRWLIGLGPVFIVFALLISAVSGGDKKPEAPRVRAQAVSTANPAILTRIAGPTSTPVDTPTPGPPTPIPPPTEVPTPIPTLAPPPFTDQLAKSYRDNRNFMIRSSTEGLAMNWSESSGVVEVSLQPKNLLNEADTLTIASQSAVVASKAFWTQYPQIKEIDVTVLSDFTNQFGASSTSPAARIFIRRTTGEKFVYEGLRDRVYGDNKALFCVADGYRIHPAIYAALKDPGCLLLAGASK